MVAGHFASEGRARSRAASTSARSPASVASRSGAGSGLIVGPGQRLRLGPAFPVEDGLPARVLHEHLDLALGLLELAVAEAGEPDALFVELQRLLQGQLALLELLHALLELLQRLLERRDGGVVHAGSLPVTVAARAPWWRRTRRPSPTATSAARRSSRRPSASQTSA